MILSLVTTAALSLPGTVITTFGPETVPRLTVVAGGSVAAISVISMESISSQPALLSVKGLFGPHGREWNIRYTPL